MKDKDYVNRARFLACSRSRNGAYAEAKHLAQLAAGGSATISDDVRDLYARGAAGEISSSAIVAAIVAKYAEPKFER